MKISQQKMKISSLWWHEKSFWQNKRRAFENKFTYLISYSPFGCNYNSSIVLLGQKRNRRDYSYKRDLEVDSEDIQNAILQCWETETRNLNKIQKERLKAGLQIKSWRFQNWKLSSWTEAPQDLLKYKQMINEQK